MNSTIVRHSVFRSLFRRSLPALSALLALNCMTLFAQKPTSAAVKKSTAAPPASAINKMQEGKIWLSLDVVEHQYNSSGSEVGKEKYRSDIDLQVIDSATNRSSTVRSGETIPLQARRTYYIVLSEVPQSYGMATRLAGQQTQIIRTPKSAGDDDVMFERKFVLNSRPGSAAGAASQREMGRNIPLSGSTAPKNSAPSGVPSEIPVGMPPRLSKYGSPLSLGNNLSNPNYYVIQYCSLKSQDDALQARSFLMRNGVRDARVEVYVDRFGQSYYRLRSGSYIDPSLAKSTIEGTLWKNRQSLGLKQKPIIVKAGV